MDISVGWMFAWRGEDIILYYEFVVVVGGGGIKEVLYVCFSLRETFRDECC